MSLEDILSVDSGRRPRQRVGRGAGSKGKTAGRGQKGEGSRSGNRAKKWFEGGQKPLYMRVPQAWFQQLFAPYRISNCQLTACDRAC